MNTPFKYKGIFEAHVSIAPIKEKQATVFNKLCQQEGAKSIEIVLARGDFPVQPMSCSRHTGTLDSVKAEVETLAQKMQKLGFEVKRLKIEAAPFNEDVPANQVEAESHSDKNYFEHHWKILVHNSPSKELITLCEHFQAHLSRNSLKTRPDNWKEHFITLRLYGKGLTETKAICDELTLKLEATGTQVLKRITEYCVYDDHVALDDNWLTPMSACLQCSEPCYE